MSQTLNSSVYCFTNINHKEIAPCLEQVLNDTDNYEIRDILLKVKDTEDCEVEVTIKGKGGDIYLSLFKEAIYTPLVGAKYAKALFDLHKRAQKTIIAFSNSPDFTQALSELFENDITFFVGQKNVGNNLGEVFKEFNKSLDYINGDEGFIKAVKFVHSVNHQYHSLP